MGFNFVWTEPWWSSPISLYLCIQDHHFHRGCCQSPWHCFSPAFSILWGLVKAFFPLLPRKTFACGDFHIVWVIVHPRFKLSLKPPRRRGKSDTKPTTTNLDLFVLLVVIVFNMAQYWIIINSFCFIGVSLSHIKIPFATENQCL